MTIWTADSLFAINEGKFDLPIWLLIRSVLEKVVHRHGTYVVEVELIEVLKILEFWILAGHPVESAYSVRYQMLCWIDLSWAYMEENLKSDSCPRYAVHGREKQATT